MIRALATCLCFAASAMAAEALQPRPGGALTLQATFDKGTAAAFGPAPTKQAAQWAVWPAADVLSNAQGAISFRVRFHKQEKPQAYPSPVMSLASTGAGEWTLAIAEGPPPKPSAKPETPEEEPDLKLEEEKEPVGELICEVQAKFFAEGSARGSTRAAVPIREWAEWHHVVWTWRSVHHAIYIDGRRRGESLQISRLEPFSSPEAIFRVTTAKADVADLRVYKRALGPAEVTLLARAKPDQFLPPLPPFRLWADWGPATGRAVVYADAAGLPAARVELSWIEEGEVLAKATMAALPSGLGEMLVKVTDPEKLPPGAYRFEGVAFDSAGKELATARTTSLIVPPWQFPWLGCQAGLKKTILPPYTPIEVEGDRIRTSLREHTLDRTGLFKSIVAAGGELLAAPVALEVVSGGKPLAFSGGPGLGTVESKGHEANWSATTASPEGHALRVEGHMEYDGLARFDLTLAPKGKLGLDRAEVVIRYRPEVMRLLHSVASGFIYRFMAVEKGEAGGWQARPINWNTYAPKEPHRREGVVFDSNDLHHEGNVSRFGFVPFVHVGNDTRGLAWFAENDRGWLHDPAVPTMEVVATDAVKELRLHIVPKPTTLAEPIAFRFYLLANPFKPLPKDWRTWVVADYQKSTEFAKKAPYRFWWHWNEYAKSFVPYPGGVQGKTYEDWVGKFKNDDLIHAPFINFGVPADSGLYGPPFFNEMAVLPYSWKLHNNRPHQDYVAYWLDKCAKEIGIKGVYVDEPYGEPWSYNVLAGDAPYIRADGTRAVGYRFLEGRDYFRRLKQMFTDHGFPYSVWVHTTNYKATPVFTFIDISMDGEHPMIWVPSFQDYHIFYNAERSRGYLSGIPFGWVGTQMFHGNTEPKTFPGLWVKSRTYLAVTLPNQVLPQTCGIPDELDRIHNLWSWFGIGDEGVEEVAEPFGGVVNRKKGQALLYATAPWKGTRIDFPDGFKPLDLGTPFNHAWNAETGASLVVDGKTVVDLAMPNDVAVVFARGAEEPQPSRPEGVLLGVSFDQGIEPDFGGGLIPASGEGDVSGKALAVGFGKAAVGYPVVPSWVQGTVEFDLQLRGLADQPLRLLALQHHLDFSLEALRRDGKPGLLLTTSEVVPQEKLLYQTGRVPMEKRELFAPLPAVEPGAWSRVALVWRSGHCELFWNGRSLGRLLKPAAARLRDAAAPAHGLLVGDGRKPAGQASAEAVLDSLLLYDWPLRAEDAAKARPPMAPVPRPAAGDAFPVWVSKQKGEDAVVAVNFAGRADWDRVSTVRLSLFDGPDAKQPAGSAELTPWLGTGVAAVPLAAPKEPKAGVRLGEPDALGDLEGAAAKDWVLQVDLIERKGKEQLILATRRIPIHLPGELEGSTARVYE